MDFSPQYFIFHPHPNAPSLLTINPVTVAYDFSISSQNVNQSATVSSAGRKILPKESSLPDADPQGVDTSREKQEKNVSQQSKIDLGKKKGKRISANQGVEVTVHPQQRGLSCQNYNFFVKNKKRTRYACIKPLCPVTLKQVEDGRWFKFNEHTCRKDDHKTLEARIFQREAKKKMKINSSMEPLAVFNECEEENPVASTHTSYPLLRKSLQRVKAAQEPTTKTELQDSYKSIREFAQYVEDNPETLMYKDKTNEETSEEKCLKGKLVKTPATGKYHYLLYDPELMNQFKDDDAHFDGTFFSCPKIKGVKQLVTIMGKKKNESFPIAWILMGRRTVEDYNSVFETIKELFPRFKPAAAHLDYEKGLRRALKESFLGIKIWSCYFHYAQSVVRRCKKMGLCTEYNNKQLNPEGHAVLKKIISLALLPADKFVEGLIHVEEFAYEVGRKQDEELAKNNKKPKILDKWQKFFGYMRREWVTKVKPANISVFSSPERTNNVLERYHRDLNDLMGGKPGVKKFIIGLIKIKERALRNVIRVQKGLPIHMSHSSTKWKVRDARIRNAMEQMKGDKIWSVKKFIEEVSDPDWDPTIETIDQDDNLRGSELFDPEEDSDWELDCDTESEEIRTKDVPALTNPTQKDSSKVTDAEVRCTFPAAVDKSFLEENNSQEPRALREVGACEPFHEENVAEAVDDVTTCKRFPLNDTQQRKNSQKRSQKDDKILAPKILKKNHDSKVTRVQESMYAPLYDEATTQGQKGRLKRKPLWMTHYVVKKKRNQTKSTRQ